MINNVLLIGSIVVAVWLSAMNANAQEPSVTDCADFVLFATGDYEDSSDQCELSEGSLNPMVAQWHEDNC